jgi:hypothetical protein
MPPELQVLESAVRDPRAPETHRQAPRCSTCMAVWRVAECFICGAEFCPRHGQQGQCNECWLNTWLPSNPPSPRWSTAGLLLGMVAIFTALGLVAGSLIDALVRTALPATPHGLVATVPTVIGFSLGWWCFATVGGRWMAEDQRHEFMEHEE